MRLDQYFDEIIKRGNDCYAIDHLIYSLEDIASKKLGRKVRIYQKRLLRYLRRRKFETIIVDHVYLCVKEICLSDI
jgi:hypothetical protein